MIGGRSDVDPERFWPDELVRVAPAPDVVERRARLAAIRAEARVILGEAPDLWFGVYDAYEAELLDLVGELCRAAGIDRYTGASLEVVA